MWHLHRHEQEQEWARVEALAVYVARILPPAGGGVPEPFDYFAAARDGAAVEQAAGAGAWNLKPTTHRAAREPQGVPVVNPPRRPPEVPGVPGLKQRTPFCEEW